MGAQMLKMQAQAKKMKRQLARETFEHEDGEIRIVVAGDQEIREIELNGEPQPRLVKVINKAIQRAQREAAMKMISSGGLDQLLGK